MHARATPVVGERDALVRRLENIWKQFAGLDRALRSRVRPALGAVLHTVGLPVHDGDVVMAVDLATSQTVDGYRGRSRQRALSGTIGS